MALPLTEASASFLTVDGDVMSLEDARKLVRGYFYGGFLALPWLWFVNCWYFWPVLRYNTDSIIRSYLVRSAIGCAVFMAMVLPWTLSFMIGGKALVGKSWPKLAVYNVADKMYMWMQN
eukprot:TRINITY_DN21109_c0_g1_i1.p1 TRINITY_DN21109_c0_g1~~TRINITY_DN21109_c0_g1_i1.p1  ORF type:complete len:119 (+),score=7.80 TRINITY_DN21109_c0_g1_i1:339-695(+)